MIRYFFAFIVLAVLSQNSPSLSQDEANSEQSVWIKSGFVKRIDYLGYSSQEQQLYVMGVVDGLLVSPMIAGNTPKEKAIRDCLSDRSITSTQIQLTTFKVVRDNPEKLDQDAHVAVYVAITDICKIELEGLK